MSGKRRIVTIPVDDERTDFLAVYECRGDPMPGEQSELLRSFDVPVPSDDQLTRDVQVLWAFFHPGAAGHGIHHATDGTEAAQAAARLRSHFRLDDEGSE